MLSFSIGSLQVLGTGVTGYIVQRPIKGLDAPTYRQTSYDKPGEHGSVVTSLLYGGRVITLQGVIEGADAATYEANRRALQAACGIQTDSSGNPLPITLSWTTLGGSSYFAYGYPGQLLSDYEYATQSQFQISFTVADGAVYGAAQVQSGLITPPTGGGFSLPVSLPITAAATTGGSVTLNNPGNRTAYPILTLTGPLTNPLVNNSASGTYLLLNYTVPAGSVVTVDMTNKTIMLNGTQSILSTKTSDSSWWGIPPGSTSISVTTASSSDTGSAQVSFYPPYLGS